MGPVSGVVVYLIVWWTVLFAVLPWGVRPSSPADTPPETGIVAAPSNPNLKKKFLATTVISAIIWLIIAYLMHIKIIDFREIAEETPLW